MNYEQKNPILNFGQLLVETKYGPKFNVPLYYVIKRDDRIQSYGIIQPNEYVVKRIDAMGEIVFSDGFPYCKSLRVGGLKGVVCEYCYPYDIYIATQKYKLVNMIKRDIKYSLDPLKEELKNIKKTINKLEYSKKQIEFFEKD